MSPEQNNLTNKRDSFEEKRTQSSRGEGKFRVRLNRPATILLPKPTLDEIPLLEVKFNDVFIVDSYHLSCFSDELEILEIIENADISGKRLIQTSENGIIKNVLIQDDSMLDHYVTDLGPGEDRMEIFVDGTVIYRPKQEVLDGYTGRLILVKPELESKEDVSNPIVAPKDLFNQPIVILNDQPKKFVRPKIKSTPIGQEGVGKRTGPGRPKGSKNKPKGNKVSARKPVQESTQESPIEDQNYVPTADFLNGVP